ncbi:MAG: hypothetical protein ACLPX5_06195 [Dissulfurispiraceae bacterium]
MSIPTLCENATDSILLKELIFHLDKTVISIPGYPRDHRNWNEDRLEIADAIKAEFNAQVRDCAIGDTKNQDDFELNYKRFKRFYHDNGLIDFFYERDFNIAPYIDNIAMFRINSKDKLDYRAHHRTQRAVDEILYHHSTPFHISEAELAIDTLHASKGRALRLFAVPVRWNCKNRLAVIENPCGPSDYYPDCNKGGNNQYYNFREDSRQWHFYEKEYNGHTIYRTEIILRRDYLRRHGIDDHEGLLDQAESLIIKNITLMAPKIISIKEDYKLFRKQKIHPTFTAPPFKKYIDLLAWPTPQWIYDLTQKLDMPRSEIMRRYFDKLAMPNIDRLY